MEIRCTSSSSHCFFIWLLLVFSATLLPLSDARKTMLSPKRLNIRKELRMDDVSIMDSSNAQPYVSSPFSWPAFDSLAPQNSPPYCILPPATPLPPSPPSASTSPGPSGTGPTPIGPNPITPVLPSPSSPTLPVPSPPDTGLTPSPPETSTSPSPSDTGLTPSPPDTGFTPSPPETGFSPSPPETGLTPSPPETGFSPSPPYFEPSPPGNPPSPPSYVPSPPTIFVPSPPIFEPPVVYPPPLVPPPRSGGAVGALWCVVKPAVPDPIIQEAMNYACASGANCGPIQSNGPCYTPDNLFAHASFAFNSYWQRTKVAGGTCSFGGTAILVTVDPSHEGCHFDYF